MSERTGKAEQADHAGEKDRSLGRRFDRSRQEILIALVMLGVFVYLRVQIEGLVRGRRGAAFLDPDFWPGWLLNILILLTIIYLVQSIMRALRPPPAEPHAEPSPAATTEPAGTAGELAADADASAEAAPLAPASQQQKEPEEEHLEDTAPRRNPVMLVMGFGLIFAFIWLMPRIGFIPSGLLFAVAFLLAVGERRLRIVATIPIVLMALILYVFTRLLVVPLPRGRGFFLELSTYFY
jgi:putative tricarboxylic transport membrane protein